MSIEQYLPSKEFKKRVFKIAILLCVVVLIRFGVYPAIKKLFEKNVIPANITVQQFVDIDTDGDGLPDWEEQIWSTNPNKTDTDGDGISDFDYVQSKKQGINAQDQNETTLLSAELMKTLFALMAKGATTEEAFANLGDAASQSIIKPDIKDTYSATSFSVSGTSTKEVKAYYSSFQNAYKIFTKSTAPDEFEVLAVAISSENPDQLKDLDGAIKKYTAFEKMLASIKVPSDVLQTHIAFTNSVASIGQALVKSQLLYTNSIVGVNGVVELRIAQTNLQKQIPLLHSYFLRNGLIKN
jgi:Bacterial TSP3 repeat